MLLRYGPLVSLAEGIERVRRGDREPAFVLSFDDGYRTSLTVAGPLLFRRGAPAAIFVATGFVGLKGEGLRRYAEEGLQWPRAGEPMSEDDLRSCAEYGIEVGSHGVSHRNFGALSGAEARAELHDSREYLEAVTGRSITNFAWPYGGIADFPARLVPVALEAGYEALYSGVSRRQAAALPPGVYPRRELNLEWGLRICRYFALRG